jgi:hypothetical protein
MVSQLQDEVRSLQSQIIQTPTNYVPIVINETSSFTDNFENYSVGTLPLQTWQFWYNTQGAITDSTCVSPTKSLRLTSPSDYWAATIGVIEFASSARYLGYQCYIKVDGPTNDESARIGFVVNQPENESTAWQAFLQFNNINGSQVITFSDKNCSYVPNVWYKVKVIFDRTSDTFNVWINDTLVGSSLKDVTTGSSITDPYQLQYFGIGSMKSTINCYFDDISLFVANSMNG